MTSDASPPAPSQNDSANAPDWDAIARFLAGECAPEEAKRVQEWLDAHPEDKELVARLDSVATIDAPADVDVEAALSSVHARMNTSRRATPTFQRQIPRWRKHATATLLLAAAIATVMVTMRPTPASKSEVLGAKTFSTAVGQRDSVTLSDGSRVLLGPDSRLVVAADYGTTSRAVELRGDGYFDVRHDAAKPFAVRVGQAVVEDLGTTFTIESDAGDTTHVAVLTGSVRLRASNSSPTSGVLLAAGDRGSIDLKGVANADRQSVREDDTAWTTGRLVFRDASLARVAGEIRRWYGVTLHVADSSLLKRHVTASFAGESIDQVLNIVALSLGARVDRQGDSATVTATHGAPTTR
jgi:transmembrane sensor